MDATFFHAVEVVMILDLKGEVNTEVYFKCYSPVYSAYICFFIAFKYHTSKTFPGQGNNHLNFQDFPKIYKNPKSR